MDGNFLSDGKTDETVISGLGIQSNLDFTLASLANDTPTASSTASHESSREASLKSWLLKQNISNEIIEQIGNLDISNSDLTNFQNTVIKDASILSHTPGVFITNSSNVILDKKLTENSSPAYDSKMHIEQEHLVGESAIHSTQEKTLESKKTNSNALNDEFSSTSQKMAKNFVDVSESATTNDRFPTLVDDALNKIAEFSEKISVHCQDNVDCVKSLKDDGFNNFSKEKQIECPFGDYQGKQDWAPFEHEVFEPIKSLSLLEQSDAIDPFMKTPLDFTASSQIDDIQERNVAFEDVLKMKNDGNLNENDVNMATFGFEKKLAISPYKPERNSLGALSTGTSGSDEHTLVASPRVSQNSNLLPCGNQSSNHANFNIFENSANINEKLTPRNTFSGVQSLSENNAHIFLTDNQTSNLESSLCKAFNMPRSAKKSCNDYQNDNSTTRLSQISMPSFTPSSINESLVDFENHSSETYVSAKETLYGENDIGSINLDKQNNSNTFAANNNSEKLAKPFKIGPSSTNFKFLEMLNKIKEESSKHSNPKDYFHKIVLDHFNTSNSPELENTTTRLVDSSIDFEINEMRKQKKLLQGCNDSQKIDSSNLYLPVSTSEKAKIDGDENSSRIGNTIEVNQHKMFPDRSTSLMKNVVERECLKQAYKTENRSVEHFEGESSNLLTGTCFQSDQNKNSADIHLQNQCEKDKVSSNFILNEQNHSTPENEEVQRLSVSDYFLNLKRRETLSNENKVATKAEQRVQAETLPKEARKSSERLITPKLLQFSCFPIKVGESKSWHDSVEKRVEKNIDFEIVPEKCLVRRKIYLYNPTYSGISLNLCIENEENFYFEYVEEIFDIEDSYSCNVYVASRKTVCVILCLKAPSYDQVKPMSQVSNTMLLKINQHSPRNELMTKLALKAYVGEVKIRTIRTDFPMLLKSGNRGSSTELKLLNRSNFDLNIVTKTSHKTFEISPKEVLLKTNGKIQFIINFKPILSLPKIKANLSVKVEPEGLEMLLPIVGIYDSSLNNFVFTEQSSASDRLPIRQKIDNSTAQRITSNSEDLVSTETQCTLGTIDNLSTQKTNPITAGSLSTSTANNLATQYNTATVATLDTPHNTNLFNKQNSTVNDIATEQKSFPGRQVKTVLNEINSSYRSDNNRRSESLNNNRLPLKDGENINRGIENIKPGSQDFNCDNKPHKISNGANSLGNENSVTERIENVPDKTSNTNFVKNELADVNETRLQLLPSKTRVYFGTVELGNQNPSSRLVTLSFKNGWISRPLILNLVIKGSQQFWFSSKTGESKCRFKELTIKPNSEETLYVLFEASAVGLYSGEIIGKPRQLSKPVKFKIPLYGLGGKGKLVLKNSSQQSLNHSESLIFKNLGTGMPSVINLTLHNKGERSIFVTVRLLYDKTKELAIPPSEICAQPSQFIIAPKQSENFILLTTFMKNFNSAQKSNLGYLQIVFVDEILRKRFLELNFDSSQWAQICPSNISTINFFGNGRLSPEEHDTMPRMPEDLDIFEKACSVVYFPMRYEIDEAAKADHENEQWFDAYQETLTSFLNVTTQMNSAEHPQSISPNIAQNSQNIPPSILNFVEPAFDIIPNSVKISSNGYSQRINVVSNSDSEQFLEISAEESFLIAEPRELTLKPRVYSGFRIKALNNKLPRNFPSARTRLKVLSSNEEKILDVEVVIDQNSVHVNRDKFVPLHRS